MSNEEIKTWIKILGTFSSVVVAISLTMKNLRWLRTVNLVGAAFFSLYGLLIGSLPVAGLNLFIVVINTYYLIQQSMVKDSFSLLEVGADGRRPEDDPFLRQFLAHHGADIRRFQPDWNDELVRGSRVVFLLREVLPVSLFVCRPDGAGNQQVLLDFAIPAWRDYKTARFFYGPGVRALDWARSVRFVAKSGVKAHETYLRKMGFHAEVTTGHFVRDPAVILQKS